MLNVVELGEVILDWFWEVILWNELRSWELKSIFPDSEKWFSILILKIYHKESKRITFNHRITSQKNQEQNQEKTEAGVVPNQTLASSLKASRLARVVFDRWNAKPIYYLDRQTCRGYEPSRWWEFSDLSHNDVVRSKWIRRGGAVYGNPRGLRS
jgi:hypothetical protein